MRSISTTARLAQEFSLILRLLTPHLICPSAATVNLARYCFLAKPPLLAITAIVPPPSLSENTRGNHHNESPTLQLEIGVIGNTQVAFGRKNNVQLRLVKGWYLSTVFPRYEPKMTAHS